MNVNLLRPIVFLDLETTGLNLAADRIVEIALLKVDQEGKKVVKRKLINPEKPIPAEVSAIHGITDDMVRDAPTFRQIANEVKQFLEGADFGGYNSNKFDWPLLMEEFLRAGLDFDIDGRRLLDVQKIYHQMEPRNLSAAYKFYCSKELENAHSAETDVNATWEVFQSQVALYPQLGQDLDSIMKLIGEDQIIDFARRMVVENGKIVFNFGKHKGRPVEEILRVEPSYYDWIMKSEFALHTKMKLTEIFNKSMLKQKER
ncbi:MAG: 3'-5' exonuclease [Chitinophagia bacterium]|jgi:DNA polymerase-3 subunit epsilon|nr:3'-5' exonuclease [Chitinophagia bacterium]